MQEVDIIDRIKVLCDSRSWSLYRLAKESGITYSTLCTMLHKSNSPSIPTLIKLCNGFGITLSQFFDFGSERAMLTDSQKELLEQWAMLTEENRVIANSYIHFLLEQQQCTK